MVPGRTGGTSHYTNTQFAASYVTGSHALKVGFTQLFGFQDYGPGEPEAEPSVGRNLGVCGSAAVCNNRVSVALIEPQTERLDRQHRLDLRVSHRLNAGPMRITAKVDFYNLFNANDIQFLSSTYGAAWLRPFSILTGRLVKFGAQLDF